MLAGIVVGYHSDIMIADKWLMYGLILFATLMIPIIAKYKLIGRIAGVYSIFLFFWIGLCLVNASVLENKEKYFVNFLQKDAVIQGKIIENPIEKQKSIQLIVAITSIGKKVVVGDAMVYAEKSANAENLKKGDVLLMKGNFNPVKSNTNPYAFDYAKFLRQEGITHQAYIKEEQWRLIGHQSSTLNSWIYSASTSLNHLLDESGMNDKNLAVAKALILGEKSHLDRETKNAYASAGAMHVLAVSGLHVGIVMLILAFVLKPIKRFKGGPLLYLVLVLTMIWFYALITGMSPSVFRASVMFSFVVIGQELERETSVYQSILVSALVLMVVEPLVVFQVGFQLSYLAVLGIVYLQPKIYNLWYIKHRWLDKVWQLTSVSLAAQLATFPIGLYYFNQFPNYFLLSNMLVIPMAFVILFIGIVYFILAWIPFLNELLLTLLDWSLSLMNTGVGWIDKLPFSATKGVALFWYETIWIYALILIFVLSWLRRRKQFFFAGLLMIVGWMCFIVVHRENQYKSNQLIIYDVGKNNAIDIIQGRDNLFIADQNLMENPQEIEFNIKPNWFHRLSKNEPTLIQENNQTLSVFQIGSKRLAVINGENGLTKLPQADYLYFYNLNYIPQHCMDWIRSNNTNVILGDNPYRLRSYVKEQLQTKVHDIKNDGAFILNF